MTDLPAIERRTDIQRDVAVDGLKAASNVLLRRRTDLDDLVCAYRWVRRAQHYPAMMTPSEMAHIVLVELK